MELKRTAFSYNSAEVRIVHKKSKAIYPDRITTPWFTKVELINSYISR